jgi:hypothetical protein
MGDNKNIQDGRDRSKVSSSETYELAYLEKELGVSREEVQKAIQAVGNNREKVTQYLKNKK